MTIRVAVPDQPIRVILQRAGYVPFRDPNTRQDSFTRRLGTYFYPRFHLYVDQQGSEVRLNLHLDQKQPSYQGSRKHAGEYDGPAVEEESERIAKFFPN